MMDLFAGLPPPATTSDLECISADNKRSCYDIHEDDALICKRKRINDEVGTTSRKPFMPRFRLVGGAAAGKGDRDAMEDAHVVLNDVHVDMLEYATASAIEAVRVKHPDSLRYYAVFDGHAGVRAASHASHMLHQEMIKLIPRYGDVEDDVMEVRKALTRAFTCTDRSFLDAAAAASPRWKDGCTAACIVVRNDVIYACNIGDSRAVLLRQGRRSSCKGSEKTGPRQDQEEQHQSQGDDNLCDSDDNVTSILALTRDHNPTAYTERRRIERNGGRVTNGRVNGILEVSRSFGDAQFKHCGVTSTPDVLRHVLDSRDRLILIACDGIWKVMNSREAVDIVISFLASDAATAMTYYDATVTAASHVVECALKRGSTDNCTALVIRIEQEN